MGQSTSLSAADLLRAAGVKVTRGRVRVLELLLSAKRPLSHAEIEARLSAEATCIERVTLYRILASLVQCGLVLKAVDARGVFCFTSTKAQQRHTAHMHFRCSGCGGVFCLKAAPPPPPRLPRGFRLAGVDYDVRGICASCARHGA